MKQSITQPESNWIYATQDFEFGSICLFDFFSMIYPESHHGIFYVSDSERCIISKMSNRNRMMFAFASCKEVK
jgi:hypothetical protein